MLKQSSVAGLQIALVQMEVEPNRPELNLRKIVSLIKRERARGSRIVVFPELAISGYMIGDKWLSDSLVHDFNSCNEVIAKAAVGITVIWGNIEIDPTKVNHDGSVRKYSAAFVAQNGKMLKQTVRKTNLPSYGEFDDRRYFSSLADLAVEKKLRLEDFVVPFEIKFADHKNLKLGIILCEDMWWSNYGSERNVAEILRKKGADLIINLSASPWNIDKNAQRQDAVKKLFPKGCGIPVAYCGGVGLQDIGKTVFCFDGGTTFYDADGNPRIEAPRFKETVLRLDLADTSVFKTDEITEIHDALVYGIAKFMKRVGKEKVVIGLSGGIDSAVAAALWVEALGARNVFAVNLPTKFNSKITRAAAKKIAANLEIDYGILPIQKNFDAQTLRLEKFTKMKFSELNRQNIQARIRGGAELIGIAAALDAIVSCNGNKTELTFGYTTLYGDLVGALAPLGDLSKSMIFDLAKVINRKAGRAIIPELVIEDLVPSAELGAEQNVDQGKGDPFFYAYHDHLAKVFVENFWQPEDILKLFLNHEFEQIFKISERELINFFGSKKRFVEDLEKSWRQFHLGIFKRIQAPPIIKISARSFGHDLREAQLQPTFSRNYLEIKKIYLGNSDL